MDKEKQDEKEKYGAPIERGTIVSIDGDRYRVASYSRDGVTSLPIKAIIDFDTYYDGVPVRRYGIGDKVFFFMFDDGNGMILGKL